MNFHTKVTPATTTRTKERTKAHGEVFTPVHLIVDMLDSLEKSNPDCFSNPTKTYIDNSCGNGNILVQILKRKLSNGSSYKEALSTIYGIDIHQDNVDECKERLINLTENIEEFRNIVDMNIICHDALTWNYEQWCPETDVIPEIFADFGITW